MTREELAGIIAPMLADGRTAGMDGVPRVGRQTRKKAEAIADAILSALRGPAHDEAAGWRPIAEMPRTLPDGERLTVWGRDPQRGQPQPWPGGGWALTIHGWHSFNGFMTREMLTEDGFTHFCRNPYLLPPP